MFSTTGDSETFALGTTITNMWSHLAVVRKNSTTCEVFLNGVSKGTNTINPTSTFNSQSGFIGKWGHNSSYWYKGYISNLRIISGSNIYSGGNFTPSSTVITTTTGGATASEVELLTCQSNRFLDNSNNGNALTINGTPKVVPFSPLAPTASYSESVHGGSMAYNVASTTHDQYLTITDDGSFNPGSGDFEISLWVYPTSFVADPGGPNFFSRGDPTDVGSTFISIQGVNGTGNTSKVDFYGGGNLVTSSNDIFLNQWNYIRARKTSSQKSLFINGVETTGASVATVTAGSSPFVGIGAQTFAPEVDGRQSHGYLCNIRYVVGSVGVESGIPTAPLSSTGTDTELLLNFTNAEIIDSTMKNNLETVNETQIDTSDKKFGTGSLVFDGDDYLAAVNTGPRELFTPNGGDMTWEMFVKFDILDGLHTLFSKYGSGSEYFFYYDNGNTDWRLVYYTSTYTWDDNSIVTGTWYHIALVKDGTTHYLFKNGTSLGTNTATENTTLTGRNFALGTTFNGSNSALYQLKGKLDEVRVTRVARYTSTFPSPTKAFANK